MFFSMFLPLLLILKCNCYVLIPPPPGKNNNNKKQKTKHPPQKKKPQRSKGNTLQVLFTGKQPSKM